MDNEMKVNPNLEFRKIESLQFLYEVSEDGHYIRNVKSKKYIKIFFDMHHSDKGYYACFINLKGKIKRIMLHRVVAECWHGPCPEGYQVDHIDRNTHNNHYTNLRYVTHSEQMKNRVMSDRMIQIATSNCMKYVSEVVSQKVIVKDSDGEIYKFPSMSQASVFLGNLCDKKPEHIRAKMKQRRKNIYGYDIIYLNAETGHAGLTRQGTVQ